MVSFFSRWSFLTSLPNLLQARGELHFRSLRKSSLRIYCKLLPIAVAVRSKASYRYSMRSSPLFLRLSHSIQTCSLTKVNSASEIFGNPFQGLPHISSSVSLFYRQLALSPNVLQSQDERPLQKLVTLSLTELFPVFSSDFVLWCDCHTLAFLTLRRFHSLLYLQCR